LISAYRLEPVRFSTLFFQPADRDDCGSGDAPELAHGANDERKKMGEASTDSSRPGRPRCSAISTLE
jgi:hypothetical protein